MLDTSTLIGLHEADSEVATYLAGVLEQHDDGTVPKTHQVVLDALQSNIAIIYVPREPETLAEKNATAAVNTIRMTDEIEHLLSQLDAREAEVLQLRFGLDRGEPRTLQEVADHFGLKPARIAQIERRALDRLRSANH